MVEANFTSGSFLRRHLPGKPLVAFPNVCFLRLMENWSTDIYTRFQINFNILCNLHIICNSHKSVTSFCEENNFKPCLTKQLLNVFKLCCEWGISLTKHQATDTSYSDECPRSTFELGDCNKIMVLSTKLNEFTIVKNRSKRLHLKLFAVVKALYHIS